MVWVGYLKRLLGAGRANADISLAVVDVWPVIRPPVALSRGEPCAKHDGQSKHDDRFQLVTVAFGLRNVADTDQGIREMTRVCRPGGRILLLEHGRSSRGRLGRLQDRWTEWHKSALGCVWNREPHELVAQAGLHVTSARRKFFGVFHVLVVSPEQL